MHLSSRFTCKIALPLLVLFIAGMSLFGNMGAVVHAASPLHSMNVKVVSTHASPDDNSSFNLQPTQELDVQFNYPTCDASCGNETWYEVNTPPNTFSSFDPNVTTGSNFTTWTLQTTWLTTLGGYIITIGATSDTGANLGTLNLTINVVSPLLVPYVSQFQKQKSQAEDCGPTSVLMVLHYFSMGPSSGSLGNQITQVRNATGNTNPKKGTTASQLEKALSHYGLSFSEISRSLTPSGAIQAMEQANTNDQPIIAFLDGSSLPGHPSNYGGHFMVVTGFSSDGQSVYVNDPDSDYSGGYPGKPSSLNLSAFQTAEQNGESDQPYGIVITVP